MDLWIRSQDRKSLIPNPKLCIDDNGGIFSNDNFLGKYELERALEVLDEIQNMIKGLALNVTNQYEVFTYPIYEMPKE